MVVSTEVSMIGGARERCNVALSTKPPLALRFWLLLRLWRKLRHCTPQPGDTLFWSMEPGMAVGAGNGSDPCSKPPGTR